MNYYIRQNEKGEIATYVAKRSFESFKKAVNERPLFSISFAVCE